jgi:hypothetical protein
LGEPGQTSAMIVAWVGRGMGFEVPPATAGMPPIAVAPPLPVPPVAMVPPPARKCATGSASSNHLRCHQLAHERRRWIEPGRSPWTTARGVPHGAQGGAASAVDSARGAPDQRATFVGEVANAIGSFDIMTRRAVARSIRQNHGSALHAVCDANLSWRTIHCATAVGQTSHGASATT